MYYAIRQCEKAAALFYATNTSTNTSIFNTSSPSSKKHNTTMYKSSFPSKSHLNFH